MNLEEPETWRILWVATAGGFLVAEMVRRLRLWFLPFAIGALVGAAAAWIEAPLPVQGALFFAVSLASLVALRPVAHALQSRTSAVGVGSGRWVGRQARVEVAIPARAEGQVVLGREHWRAQSGMGVAIPAGSTVLVTAIDGTHLTVVPLELPDLSDGFGTERDIRANNPTGPQAHQGDE